MALNPFFLQGSQSEQRLVQELINEQLKIYGVDVTYIPRKVVGRGKLFGFEDLREISSSTFDDNYLIEAYIQNYDGYSGSGDILTKFGMSLRDEVTLIISKERFEDFISPFLAGLPEKEILNGSRPKEGDLIYFPLGGRLFEVKFVEHESPFYQLGKNYVYELKCELFEYEDEVIDTSIDEIDRTVKDQGYITTLILSGVGATATASANVTNNGYIRKIFLNDDGYGYTSTPTVTFSPPLGGQSATAVAITTSKNGVFSISQILLTNAGFGYTSVPSITITGGNGTGAAATCSIERTYRGIGQISVNTPGSGYPSPPLVTISNPTGISGVATAGISTLGQVNSISIINGGSFYDPNKNPIVTFSTPSPQPVGFITATGFAVVGSAGTITSILLTDVGFGYIEPPSISIGSSFTDKVGLNTALAVSVVNNDAQVVSIRIVDPGNGYISGDVTVTIANPPRINGIGTYLYNELVVGEQSRTTARVKSWDIDTNTLKVGINSGTFYRGEDLVGAASSAVFAISSYDQWDIYDPYAQNDEIEQISDQIIDFSETNPFGNY
jgi:hypothetical protein